MDKAHGLVDPTGMFCITGSHTNELVTTSQGAQIVASYLVYVEQNKGTGANLITIGYALPTIESGQIANPSDYPLTWNTATTENLHLPYTNANYRHADKYVNAGLDLGVPGEYTPQQATEHIVICLDNVIKIISLDDMSAPPGKHPPLQW